MKIWIADEGDITGKPIQLPSAPPPLSTPPTCPPLTLPQYLDHWIPLNSLEEMAQKEYDVLIVGSGAGGGAALWRLCEQWKNEGKRIGMIEAGELLIPTNALNISTLDASRFQQYILNPEISVPTPFPEFPAARQVFALGGRTLVWDVNSPRMHSSVFKDWPVSAKEMELYYNIAERVMNVTQAYTKQSPINQLLLNRLWYNGFPEAADTPKAMNLKPLKYGKVSADVFFSSILFLAKALELRNFDLAVKSRAVRVLLEGNRAAGVEVMDCNRKSFVLKAKNVVLSASTFETPRLLLNSGITIPAVGHYLIDHAALKATAVVERGNLSGDVGPLWILVPQTDQRPYQFLISRTAATPQEEIGIIVRGYGSVKPRFENRVALDPQKRDQYGVPGLQVDYSYTPRDEAAISGVANMMKEILSALKVTSISQNICLRPPGDDHHESGTCRIGDDPCTSAANRYGQIHGISGLYVADNSALPSLGAANPTLTTIALAIRTADYISIQRNKATL